MTDVWWFLLGYFTIGCALMEGAQWARGKWKMAPLNKLAKVLTFIGWPIIIFMAFVLAWRDRK